MVTLGYLRPEPDLDAPTRAAWIEAQRLAIRRFCRKKRLELVRFFEDKEEMLEALQQKEADCALVCGPYEGDASFSIDQLEKKVEIRFFSNTLKEPLFFEAV